MKRKVLRGFTLIELLVVVAIIALLISILLPSLSRARELAKRAVCRANLRGIGQSAFIYANDNDESFPIAFFNRRAGISGDPTNIGVNAIEQMGGGGDSATGTGNGLSPQAPNVRFRQARTVPTGATNVTSANTDSVPISRSLFLLVIGNFTTPKQFVCPSSGETEDDLRNIDGTQTRAAQPGINRFDFYGYNNLSYGYQHPYGRDARPGPDLDNRMALAADRSPFFQVGGNGGRADDMRFGGAGSTGTWNWANVGASVDSSDVKTVLSAPNTEWQAVNSPNHGEEGQSILYIDSSVQFENKPIVGANNDNIYTAFETPLPGDDDAAYLQTLRGTPPDVDDGPAADTDTLIAP